MRTVWKSSTSRIPRHPGSCPNNIVRLNDAHTRLRGAHLRLRGGRQRRAGHRRCRRAPRPCGNSRGYDAGGKLHDAAMWWSPRPMPRCSPTSPTEPAGLKVLQLISPESQPKFYGFSPEPRPAAHRLLRHLEARAEPVEGPGSRSRESTRPATRSRCSVDAARARSIYARCAACSSTLTASHGS